MEEERDQGGSRMKLTNGELQFDFKGADDAVAFIIGMGRAIASGQVTMETIEAAKRIRRIIKRRLEENQYF